MRIFWNVDTQYDFMRKDGELYVPNAELIEPKLAILTKYAKDNGIKVFNSADLHNEDSKELSENPDFKTKFPPHCMRGTKGAKYISVTAPDGAVVDWEDLGFDKDLIRDSREVTITKDAFDVFQGNPYTKEILGLIKPDKAVVYGVATNYCVDYAVMGLLNEGVDVYVPMDAVKELPAEDEFSLEATLEKWKGNGVKLTTVDEVIA